MKLGTTLAVTGFVLFIMIPLMVAVWCSTFGFINFLTQPPSWFTWDRAHVAFCLFVQKLGLKPLETSRHLPNAPARFARCDAEIARIEKDGVTNQYKAWGSRETCN